MSARYVAGVCCRESPVLQTNRNLNTIRARNATKTVMKLRPLSRELTQRRSTNWNCGWSSYSLGRLMLSRGGHGWPMSPPGARLWRGPFRTGHVESATPKCSLPLPHGASSGGRSPGSPRKERHCLSHDSSQNTRQRQCRTCVELHHRQPPLFLQQGRLAIPHCSGKDRKTSVPGRH